MSFRPPLPTFVLSYAFGPEAGRHLNFRRLFIIRAAFAFLRPFKGVLFFSILFSFEFAFYELPYWPPGAFKYRLCTGRGLYKRGCQDSGVPFIPQRH